MRVALVQRNVKIGDFDAIRATWRDAWRRGAQRGAELVVLPELATTGYPPRDLLEHAEFVEANLRLAAELVAWTARGPALLFGCVERNEDSPGRPLRNAAVLAAGGRVVGRVFKSLLPTYDVFDEDRYFEPASQRRPLSFGGFALGVTICEDLWADPHLWKRLRYQVNPAAELAAQGANLFINISASPYSVAKASVRRHLVTELARQHGAWSLYCNQTGAHDELIFDGHSIAAAPGGEVALHMASFGDDLAVIDVGSPGGASPHEPVLAVERGDTAPECWEEEVWRALCLGVGDYVRKSGFEGVVVGLSGGIDSSLVCAIAAEALGPEHVWGVAMPARFSSRASVEDAAELARRLGVRFDILDIDESFSSVLSMLAPVFGDTPFGVAEENLQARLRGLTLMAIANKYGRLVLTTGNKSELAVGYCTLYGDMAGALDAIGDLVKTRVYAVARWLNATRGEPIPPRVLSKPPSAELRPNQTDQDTLPPYEVLDVIVEDYVERCKPAAAIAADGGLDPELVASVLRMIDRAEYKRRQAPPVLRVTTKAFGIGRRMPIVARFHG